MEKKIIKRHPLGNPVRPWKQDKFIFSAFNGVTDENQKIGFLNAQEAGFNMLEFGWATSEELDRAIPIAEEVGMDIMIQDWRHFGGFQETREKVIDMADLEEYVKFTKKYRHIVGYYVWDEPYYQSDIEKARAQVDIMEKLDPERLPFVVAIPSYNKEYRYENDLFDEYMDRYCKTIEPNVLSLDFYCIRGLNETDQIDQKNIYKDLFVMRRLCRQKKMPMWFYFQSSGDLSVVDGSMLGVNFRHIRDQVYLSLLYGTKGLQYYNITNGIVCRADGSKGEYFEDVKKLNRQILMWSPVLMSVESDAVYHSPEVLKDDPKFRSNYCDNIADSGIFDGELPNRISAAEFSDCEGNKYIMIMNRDYIRRRPAEIKLKDYFRLYEVCKESGKQYVIAESANEIKLNLEPADAVLYRVQKTSEEAFDIEYVLEK
ncbi:MAG: hypothetical protein E7588_01635 [Ruminococcaceae bacterium]|nr:hypothetical protein [Oscillospiraceae bacterium]